MIIYLVYNRINGKCYVGQTVQTLEQRWYLHVKCSKGKSKLPIHCAIRKYGPNAFMVGWLSHARSLDELNALECHFIERYHSMVPNGYNRTAGGKGFNGNHTAASRMKMQQSHRGKKQTLAARLKRSATILALWQTAEFRNKNKGRQGKTTPEATRRRQSEAAKADWKKRKS